MQPYDNPLAITMVSSILLAALRIGREPLFFLFLFLLIISRRLDQFIAPQVWVEDGTVTLFAFLQRGWASAFEPVSGYLVLISKLLSLSTASFTLYHYPLVSSILAAGFSVLVGILVYKLPTRLKLSALCAVAIFFVPTDPEVYGLPSYAFWWSAIPLLLLVLWEERSSGFWIRVFLLVIGGLSSPVIVAILPALMYRYIRNFKSLVEGTILLTAIILASVQLYFLSGNDSGAIPPLMSIVTWTPVKFIGGYLVGCISESPKVLTFAFIVAAAPIALASWRNKCEDVYLLYYLLAACTALSAFRVDPAVLHQLLAGPRYFFLPFICLSWLLLYLASVEKNIVLRVSLIAILTCGVLNSFFAWSRDHAELNWKNHIYSCQFFPTYTIPFMFNGTEDYPWHQTFEAKFCQGRILDPDSNSDEPSYPFRTIIRYDTEAPLPKQATLVKNNMPGTDYDKTKFEGLTTIGSFKSSDSDTGSVLIKLKRGDRLMFNRGPVPAGQTIRILESNQNFITTAPSTPGWIELEFSSRLLPDEFVVQVTDEGEGWGQWSAVAL